VGYREWQAPNFQPTKEITWLIIQFDRLTGGMDTMAAHLAGVCLGELAVL